VAIECSDILFAVDSVAAALSITHDRCVLYSANIFAILGLRALYLLLASLIRDWPYLHYGITASPWCWPSRPSNGCWSPCTRSRSGCRWA
jgi:hypothetical protein